MVLLSCILKTAALIFIAWALLVILSRVIEKKKKWKPFTTGLASFTIAGHRGASGERPANTLESFRRTLEIDPEALLEMDVWETSDGHAVVMHDGIVDTVTDGTGEISDFTLEALQRLDAGYTFTTDGGNTFPFRGKGYRIPALSEILAAFPGTPKSIDVKCHDISFAGKVMKEIEAHDEIESVIIGSFNGNIHKFIRKNYPSAATSFTMGGTIFFFIMQKLRISGLCPVRDDAFFIPEFSSGKFPDYMGPGFRQGIRIIDRHYIRAAHRRGIPVFAWTINREENMRRLREWGVDGIVTDHPARLKDLIMEEIREGKP